MDHPVIPISDWSGEKDSPLPSAVSYGSMGNLEEYFASMKELPSSQMEEKGLDDDLEGVFDDEDDDDDYDDDDDDDGEDIDMGGALLSLADEDYEYSEDEDDEEGQKEECNSDYFHNDDEDGGSNNAATAKFNMEDIHPSHRVPTWASSSVVSPQQPTRLSPAELKQLATAYEIERSDGEESDNEDSASGNGEGGVASFLLCNDEAYDCEQDRHMQRESCPKISPQQQQQQQQLQEQHESDQLHKTAAIKKTKTNPKIQPQHPYIRQEKLKNQNQVAGKAVAEGDSEKKKKKKSRKDAEKKHKMLILAIMEKKRKEEEDLLEAVRKAELKRKKFKEALLEKALRSKQNKEEQAKEQPARKPNDSPEQDLDDEEALKLEESAAREKMEAAVKERKRFVKNQKAILAALREKKEQKERKRQQQYEEEERQREVLRKRNEKLARQREQKQQRGEREEAVGSALAAIRATRSQEGKPPHAQEAASGSTARSLSAAREGEALKRKALRPRRQSDQSGGTSAVTNKNSIINNNDNNNSNISKRQPRQKDPEQAVEDEEEVERGREEAEKEKERRREEARIRQERVSQQLALIAEQRREAAEQAKKKEERAKIRAEVLKQRVQQEYSERKQMAIEDKFINGDVKLRKAKGVNIQASEEASKPRKKVTPDMASAMVDRMQAKKLKARSVVEGKGNDKTAMSETAALLPPARDFLDWKRKHGVPPETKVFCMTGWYPCVKEALLDRGWVYNPDAASPHCDLKWTLRSSDVTKSSLQSWQLTNHFMKNIALTTKIGLMKSLQQLNWVADVRAEDIFPRGYDLSSPLEIQEYLDDFRHEHVVNIFKRLYLKVTGLEGPEIAQAPLPSPRVDPSEVREESCVTAPPAPVVELESFLVNKAVFEACCAVLTRYLNPYFKDNSVDDHVSASTPTISAVEWEVVSKHDLESPATLSSEEEEPVDEFLREKEREMEQNALQGMSNMDRRKAQAEMSQRARRERSIHAREREKACASLQEMVPLGADGFRTLHSLLCQCKIVSREQFGLNGSASEARNMWIVKPAAKSRGRGIMAFNDLHKLLSYVELGKLGKSISTSSQWIVQKYMENPLIIANRKFDFRQWVLVTNWNPLTVYFYKEFYCRFSAEDYDTSDDAMSNTFVHLVNNSIGKNNENFHKSIEAENGEDIAQYMWSDEQFSNYAQFATHSSDTMVKIRNRMKDIAIWSLMCGAEAIEHRKNSWELYGFDFMLDDRWTPWLIEINSSPACDYSTSVTERYIKKALVEVLKVALDVREWEKLPKSSRPERPGTGGWECIYTGPSLDTNTNLGTDMSIQGEPMKLPRKKPSVFTSTLSGDHSPVARKLSSEAAGKTEATQRVNPFGDSSNHSNKDHYDASSEKSKEYSAVQEKSTQPTKAPRHEDCSSRNNDNQREEEELDTKESKSLQFDDSDDESGDDDSAGWRRQVRSELASARKQEALQVSMPPPPASANRRDSDAASSEMPNKRVDEKGSSRKGARSNEGPKKLSASTQPENVAAIPIKMFDPFA